MKTIKELNNFIKVSSEAKEIDPNNISDGYHTFGELYDHRIALFIGLANLIHFFGSNTVWKSLKHSDGSEWEGWFIAGISTVPGEQISYHLPIDKWKELKVQEYEKAPEWDGHQSKDVIERIKILCAV